VGAAAWIVIGIVVLAFMNNRSTVTPGLDAFAKAIAVAEGFGVPGAIPTDRHNPGDLTDGTGTIRTFATDDDGWNALYSLLARVASGTSQYYTPTMTIAQFGSIYTATQQHAWTSNVVASLQEQGFDVDSNTPIAVVLT
jgi:hypothetical protein